MANLLCPGKPSTLRTLEPGGGLTDGQEHGGSPSEKIALMIAIACDIAWSRTVMPARALEELGRL